MRLEQGLKQAVAYLSPAREREKENKRKNDKKTES